MQTTSSELRSHYTPLLAQHAAYSTTPSNLSSSPFRLKYVPNKPQSDASFDEHTQSEQADGGEGGTNYYSPHQPKRQWPPDMSKLSPKHQLRLERKYRRRAALKYARPQWVKATKLMQWGVIICLFYPEILLFSRRVVLTKSLEIVVVIYSVLFMEWGKEGEQHPLEGVSPTHDLYVRKIIILSNID